jgi:hypothetical protein
MSMRSISPMAAVEDQFDAAFEDFLAALLGAVLENAVVFHAGIEHRLVLGERVAQRFFT